MMFAVQPSDLRTVYGCLMHHAAEHERLGEMMLAKPYEATPRAPVLYIKPSNTFSAHDAHIHLPQGASSLQVRACLGLFFKPNRQLAGIEYAQSAIEFIVNAFADYSLPQPNFFRPPVKFNALDGALGLPAQSYAITADALFQLRIETWVNGVCAFSYQSKDWLQPAPEMLKSVSEFIAWEEGDVLLMGAPSEGVVVKAGDEVELRVALPDSSVLPGGARQVIAEAA
jgi:5-oxopent-3-ene-1,2,5-tricarboxylate decarboxylase / 2-hydroxyhepta-2,4-diene-1,7-dioate isomerase